MMARKGGYFQTRDDEDGASGGTSSKGDTRECAMMARKGGYFQTKDDEDGASGGTSGKGGLAPIPPRGGMESYYGNGYREGYNRGYRAGYLAGYNRAGTKL
jgi:hypothetical protein